MGDASSLRQALSQTNNDVKTIQSSASFMMSLYDRSSLLAVSEWRNTLQSCQTSQLLPLLYVANEVLQNSKRNRGNNFLVAFSPVLADSLKFICERDRRLVEKVRRTAKIWGDRRVFSTRFVGSLLKGLEIFRETSSRSSNLGNGTTASTGILRSSTKMTKENPALSIYRRRPPPSPSPTKSPPSNSDDNVGVTEEIESDDDTNDSPSSSDFRSEGPSLLNVPNISIQAPSASTNNNSAHSPIEKESESSNPSLKRRRPSKAENSSVSPNNDGISSKRQKMKKPRKRRPKTLSPDALIQLLDQLMQLESQFQTIDKLSIKAADLATRAEGDVEEDNLVGEELLTLHTDINDTMRNLAVQERDSHRVAIQQKELEAEMMRYVVWAKAGLVVDEEEIRLCDEVEKKLVTMEVVHARAKKEREIKRDKEAKERAVAEALARQKEQEEKLKQSLEATLSTTEETSRPGMVWNKAAREFQYMPDVTEESWRD